LDSYVRYQILKENKHKKNESNTEYEIQIQKSVIENRKKNKEESQFQNDYLTQEEIVNTNREENFYEGSHEIKKTPFTQQEKDRFGFLLTQNLRLNKHRNTFMRALNKTNTFYKKKVDENDLKKYWETKEGY